MAGNPGLKRTLSAALRNAHPSSIHLFASDLLGLRRFRKSPADRLTATMGWLKAAHDACGAKGVSGGYSLIDGWLPAYPETTGYIIPTFYDYAEYSGGEEWRIRAAAMADWEVSVQMPNGAVQAGLYKGKNAPRVPAVFNTGQVILGWCRAFVETRNESYLEAARRAGGWLVDVQGEDGAWRFESSETETAVHAYDVRTAWSLLELHEVTQETKYLNSAKRQMDWTLDQQLENGWFDNNAFFTSADMWTAPFTHTIAYVMEGLQEAYRLVREPLYLQAYSKTAEKLMRTFELRKTMPGDFDENWKTSGNYTCLTGNAQIAGVWIKHFEITGDVRFLNAALKLNDVVRSTQNVQSLHAGIRGGVKGSHPINGRYTPFIFPNWAAKFFADGLMAEEKVMKEFEQRVMNGEKFC